MSREDWIENRADEIYDKWVGAYPIMRRNEDALSDIAVREATAEFESLRDESAVARAEAVAEENEREAERRSDFV